MSNFNFSIKKCGIISEKFLERNISDFKKAMAFIKNLPYKRNFSKNELTNIFIENCGTCSTKHAVLKQLSDENENSDAKLMLGIYRMNGINTPAVSETLQKYNLKFIPEAHCYLKINGEINDCTFKNSTGINFSNDLLDEIEVTVEQVISFKVNYHQQFLARWILENHQMKFKLHELWLIREECISSLFEKNQKIIP